jgi:hypothetical protein
MMPSLEPVAGPEPTKSMLLGLSPELILHIATFLPTLPFPCQERGTALTGELLANYRSTKALSQTCQHLRDVLLHLAWECVELGNNEGVPQDVEHPEGGDRDAGELENYLIENPSMAQFPRYCIHFESILPLTSKPKSGLIADRSSLNLWTRLSIVTSVKYSPCFLAFTPYKFFDSLSITTISHSQPIRAAHTLCLSSQISIPCASMPASHGRCHRSYISQSSFPSLFSSQQNMNSSILQKTLMEWTLAQ